MDQITDLTKKTASALWAATLWTWAALCATTVWAARTSWAATKWAARVALWIVFWPVGLWRSIRHGRNRRHAELVAALKKAA